MSTAPFLLQILRNYSIPLRLRKKIGKAIGTPKPGIEFQVKLFEGVFEGKTGNHLDNKIYYYGAHEASTLLLLREIARKQQNPVYADIGTNIGQHLMAVAPLCKTAFGFEPWARVRDIAESKLKRNNMDHAKVMPFGLGEAPAFLSVQPPPEENLGTGLFTDAEGADKISLEVRQGDAVMEEHNIAPTLIKIDTEGFEAQVLRGLKKTLARHRPVIVFELSDTSRKDFSSLEALQSFFPKGYTFQGILPSRAKPKLVPFTTGRKFENLVAWPDRTIQI